MFILISAGQMLFEEIGSVPSLCNTELRRAARVRLALCCSYHFQCSALLVQEGPKQYDTDP